jgi:predicted DsbA family dithiol-disulfide isomerase
MTTTPRTHLKIDIVSDVSCPWCVIGLTALENALVQAGDAVTADLHFQPFEINPDMPPGGQDMAENLTRKYGSTPEQQAQSREAIRQRGAALGFEFRPEGRDRIYNTFDAHRLLYWAGTEDAKTVRGGHQRELKKAILSAYFTHGQSPADHDVLVLLAGQAGLDETRARAVLASEEFGLEVREREQFYQRAGISGVPAVIINDRHLISGGQPVEVFEQALRQIAGQIGVEV